MADALGNLILGLYRGLGTAAQPLLPLAMSSRQARGKEDAARMDERYGQASLPRPEGRLVWVHAASVGETNAVLPLVRRLTGSGFAVLFTCTTITAAGIAQSALPDGAVHQFAPLDVPASVARFLDHWRPDAVIFVESELWPAMLTELERRGKPPVVVNGRVSDRSYRRWQRLSPIARALFSRIGLVLAQSDRDGDRFRHLGARHVAVTGNLKFDTPPLVVDEASLAALRQAIGGRPAWIAASTHEGEEKYVAAAHLRLRAAHGDVLTILAPRHPSRGDSIRVVIADAGLTAAQRSRGEPVEAGTDVYLADTLGELGLFFRLSPIAFLGGSLVATGGHNPIEPLRLGAAPLHGPHVHNFPALFELIDGIAPALRVDDAAGLADAVGRFLSAPSEAREIADKGAAAMAPLSGALDRTMAALEPVLAGKANVAQ